MARNRIKFKSSGFRAILVGGGTRSAVMGAGEGIAGSAPGTEVRAIQGGYGGGRIIAFVATRGRTEKQANAQREALVAAVHRGA